MERLKKLVSDIFLGLVVTFVILYVLVCFNRICKAAEPIRPEFDITVTTTIVHWFDTEMELQEYLGEPETIGMASCEWKEAQNISLCDLYLVRPTDLEDVYNLDSIGHEFLHAFYGAYHNED